MNSRKNILKSTFKFIATFIGMTIGFLLIFGLVTFYLPTGKPANNYVPISQTVDPEKLDWQAIGEIGGKGALIDSDGNLVKSYLGKVDKKSYSKTELMDLFALRGNKETVFLYKTKDDKRLLIIYPKKVFATQPTMDLNTVMGTNVKYFSIFLIISLVSYLYLIYKITARLSKSLEREFELIRADKDEKENLFFKGLAHDVKTPLSIIISYSQALEEGLVEEEEIDKYYKSIYNNGNILKERVNDMLELTSLGSDGMFLPREGDILEAIRRYVGNNYSYFIDNHAIINIDFLDNEKYIVNYDSKLFERALENLLKNSIDHNNQGVNITIQWKKKSKVLTLTDDGKGIPEHIRDHLWEPMVTGDKSRTGHKLRGMGLANVKRIIELHGWTIEYDRGFNISIK